MNFPYNALEKDLRELLAALHNFTPSELSEVEELLTVGEYGVAFETICGITNEEGKFAPVEVRSKIRDLAERMNIDPVWWQGIIHRR